MKRCTQCGLPEVFPLVEELGIELGGAESSHRGWTSARLYIVLQRRGGVTIDELRKAAWPYGEERVEGTIHVMLARLDRRLAAFGLSIARVGIGREDRTYRLVGL